VLAFVAALILVADEPHAITFMRSARDAITSAHIRWTMRLADGSVTPYEFRLGTNGDALYARSPVPEDEDSIRFPEAGKYKPPMAWLLDDDGTVWQRDQNTSNLEHYTLNEKNIATMDLQDPRSIGGDYRIARDVQSKSIFRYCGWL
jgi:hypothetical protein